MATAEQIQMAIDNARAGGDEAAVARLTAALKDAQPEALSAEQVIGGAIANTPSSAWNLANDYYQAIRHPIQTADAMLDVAAGGISNGLEYATGLDMFPENKATATADAVGQFYKDRYGGWENVKNTIATDPIGFVADASVPLTLGGNAGARAPGVMGRVGQIAASTGRMIDPVTHVPEVARVLARRGANALGVRNGAGSAAIFDTFNTARSGTAAERAALDANLKGTANIEDVVPVARRALQGIRDDRAAAYTSNMQATRGSAAQIPFQPIVDAWNRTLDTMTQGGMWTGGSQSTAMARKLHGIISTWANSPSAHTPWGLDGLKKRISKEVTTLGPGVKTDVAEANRLAETMRDTVEQQIIANDPGYAQAMQAYAEPSNLIRQLESSLSLNNKASVDTTLRKLQSVMRNNVSTNWGYRRTLADELNAREPTLIPALAGQSLNSGEARGVARMGAGNSALSTGLIASLAGLGPAAALGVAGVSHVASIPRVAGEIAQKSGQVAGLLDQAANVAPARVRAVARKAVSPEVRGATQEAGGAANQAEGVIQIQGIWYDAKGNPIEQSRQ